MSEHSEQVVLFEWVAVYGAQIPGLDRLFAIPNGGLRKKSTAAKMKAEGAKAGVLDIMLPSPVFSQDEWRHGLWIEMKFGRTRLTPEQKEWAGFLMHQGYEVIVAYGARAAARAVLDYLGYTNERTERFLEGL